MIIMYIFLAPVEMIFRFEEKKNNQLRNMYGKSMSNVGFESSLGLISRL